MSRFNRTAGTNTAPYFAKDGITLRPARKEHTRGTYSYPGAYRNAQLYCWLSDELEARFGMTGSPDYNAPSEVYEAHNALIVAAKRVVLVHFLVNELGVDARWVTPAHLKFSRKAGCSCGCSPGFKASADLTAQLKQQDVFINAELASESVALVRVA